MPVERNSVTVFVRKCLSRLVTALPLAETALAMFGLAAPLIAAGAAENWQDVETKTNVPIEQEPAIAAGSMSLPDRYPLRDLPPLSRMVLYNSGVGQLQHTGTIEGNARLEIHFGDFAVDDVLKSLVLVDHGGGYAKAFEYKPAPDPEDVAAATIGSPMTLAQLMQSFRGEYVLLTSDGDVTEGIIYGLENRAGESGFVETVVLLTDRGLQSVPIPSIDRLQFRKEELRTQLDQAMEGLVKARRQNEKQIGLLLEGTGKRVVEFGYVIDMPIWRMTYRLAIDGDKAFLQGWAHVDNITGVDWNEIELELRSGHPYVWHANVFSPLLTQRPSVGDSVYEFSGSGVMVSRWFGFDSSSGRFSPSSQGQGGGGFGGGGFAGGFGGGGFGGSGGSHASESREEADEESTFQSFATASQDQLLVSYKIDQPVSLRAGHSAAIPVFGHAVPASMVTVWTDHVETGEALPPASAVEIANETGLPMVAGPVSISRKGDFSGDARLPRLAGKERKIVIFGVDRALNIYRKSHEPEVTSRRLEIGDGELATFKNVVTKRIYRVQNDDVEPRTVVLFVPLEEIKGLVVSPEPQVRSEGMLQYRMEVGPEAEVLLEVAFAIEERSVRTADLFSRDDLQRIDREKTLISEDDRQFLQKLVEWNQQIALVAASADSLQIEQTRLLAEQVRMRENVQALRENPDAARPFIQKMLELETSLEKNRHESYSLHAKLSELKKQKADAIEYSQSR